MSTVIGPCDPSFILKAEILNTNCKTGEISRVVFSQPHGTPEENDSFLTRIIEYTIKTDFKDSTISLSNSNFSPTPTTSFMIDGVPLTIIFDPLNPQIMLNGAPQFLSPQNEYIFYSTNSEGILVPYTIRLYPSLNYFTLTDEDKRTVFSSQDGTYRKILFN